MRDFSSASLPAFGGFFITRPALMLIGLVAGFFIMNGMWGRWRMRS